jgi:hypothetical protein
MSTECMFSCLSFVASSDTEVEDDAQGDATDRLFSGLDFTYKDSNAKDDAAQQPTYVSTRTSPSASTKPTNPVTFARKRTVQQANLRWGKSLISTIMPAASRLQVQQLNELLHAIRTPYSSGYLSLIY